MSFIKNKDNYHVWVLAPYLETEDENLQYYYDYTQSIAEYQKVFTEAGCTWTWVNVTMDNIEMVISDIKNQTAKRNIALNLCDGDEINVHATELDVLSVGALVVAVERRTAGGVRLEDMLGDALADDLRMVEQRAGHQRRGDGAATADGFAG